MRIEIRRTYKNGRDDSIEIHEGQNVSVKDLSNHWEVTLEDGNRFRWITKGKQWTVNILNK